VRATPDPRTCRFTWVGLMETPRALAAGTNLPVTKHHYDPQARAPSNHDCRGATVTQHLRVRDGSVADARLGGSAVYCQHVESRLLHVGVDATGPAAGSRSHRAHIMRWWWWWWYSGCKSLLSPLLRRLPATGADNTPKPALLHRCVSASAKGHQSDSDRGSSESDAE
jgi:hypothetical protein